MDDGCFDALFGDLRFPKIAFRFDTDPFDVERGRFISAYIGCGQLWQREL
jgi:hypothetical protein